MIKINKSKMKELGYNWENLEDLYTYADVIIDWLESHNKNYTEGQYRKILALKDLIEMIDIE